MLKHSSRSMFVISFVLVLTGLCAGTMAQSGRRTTKTKPVPVSTPEPTAAPTPKRLEPAKPALTLIVGMDHYHGQAVSNILESFVDRLDDNRSVKVLTAFGGMTRGEAVKRAKAQTEAYVVWLEVRTDSMSGEIDGRSYFIEYSVFAPATAKLATSGRAFAQAYRNKSVILNPRRSGIYGDYELQQAAREAAARILRALEQPLTPKTLPSLLSN